MKVLRSSARPKFLGLTLFGLMAAMPAHAGSTCDLNDGNPNNEVDGGSIAPNQNALACGFGNQALSEQSTAFGFFNLAHSSATAVGNANTANAANATAVGSANAAMGVESTAVGFLNVASGWRSSALGSSNTAIGDLSTAAGEGTSARGLASISFGSWHDADGNGIPTADMDADQDGMLDSSSELTTAFGDHSAAIGSGAWAFGHRSAAFGTGSFAAADDSVAIGSGSRADEANTVSVGSVGNERRVVNVAEGIQGTDAVNRSQLDATLNTAKAYTDTAVATGGTKANAYTDDREAEIRKDMDAGDTATLSAANDYTDKKFADLDFSGLNDRFDTIDRRIGHLDSRLDRVGALSAAMVGMASSAAAVEGGRTRIGIAAGAYGGKQALSVGLQQRLSPRAALTVGGAFSGSERSATVGVGFGF